MFSCLDPHHPSKILVKQKLNVLHKKLFLCSITLWYSDVYLCFTMLYVYYILYQYTAELRSRVKVKRWNLFLKRCWLWQQWNNTWSKFMKMDIIVHRCWETAWFYKRPFCKQFLLWVQSTKIQIDVKFLSAMASLVHVNVWRRYEKRTCFENGVHFFRLLLIHHNY